MENLSDYARCLSVKEKNRYVQKLNNLNGVDPYTMSASDFNLYLDDFSTIKASPHRLCYAMLMKNIEVDTIHLNESVHIAIMLCFMYFLHRTSIDITQLEIIRHSMKVEWNPTSV